MSFIKAFLSHMKPQTGKHYRLVRLDPTNVDRKKLDGYDFVTPGDPSIKGTPLEKHAHVADGTVRCGGMALAQMTQENADRLQKALDEKGERRVASIQRAHFQNIENLQRELGPNFKLIKPIVGEEKEE